MIAHDLKCRQGHQFEAWFKDIGTFETQRKGSLIECPLCGSSEIEMVFRPKAIRRQRLSDPPAGRPGSSPRIEDFLREHFEDVGTRFAEEARKVHYGESDPRNILGEATADEERELLEEGVNFFKISIPKPS